MQRSSDDVGQPDLSLTDLASLPPVLDVPTAGRLLGLGRSAAYDLVFAGEWPTPVLRLGRRYRIPRTAARPARRQRLDLSHADGIVDRHQLSRTAI